MADQFDSLPSTGAGQADEAQPADQYRNGLDPLAVQKAWRVNIAAGALGTIFVSGTGGLAATGFALALGAGEFQIGLLGAMGLIGLSAQVFGAYFVESRRERKVFWLVSCGLHRLLWLPILLIPYTMTQFGDSAKVQALLGLILVSSLLANASSPAWMSWMADVVPERQQGKFWARRSVILTCVGIVAGVPIAVVLDYMKSHARHGDFLGYTIVFAVAMILGELDVALHKKIPHPPMGPPSSRSLVSLFMRPLADKNFRRLIVLMAAWDFSVHLFVPFTSKYLLQDLGLSFLAITLMFQVNSIAYASFSKFWGFMIDRFGKRPVIVSLMALKFLTPTAYLFTSPERIYSVLIPMLFVDGFLNAGLLLAFHTALMSYAPREGRAIFFAINRAFVGLAAAVAPVLSGAMLEFAQARGFEWSWGPFDWTHMHLAFLASAICRVFVWPLAFRLSEPGSASTGKVVRQFVEGNPFRLAHHLHVLSDSPQQQRRLRSARALAAFASDNESSQIAFRELTEALHDPDREIRAAAALALGRIRSPEAVEALVEALHSPELDIQGPAARALGEIACERSVEALIAQLASEDASLRGQAARALGQTRSLQAIPALITLFQSDQPSPVLASASEALSRIGQVQAVRVILPRLRHAQNSPTVRGELAVAIGNLLGEDGEFYSILSEETHAPGLASARLAAAIEDDLRGLEAASEASGDSKRHAKRIRKALQAMQNRRFADAAGQISLLAQDVMGIAVETLAENERETLLAQRIDEFISARPKLGTQLWYICVAGSREFAEKGPFGMEIALLAFYTAAQLLSALRRQPGLLAR